MCHACASMILVRRLKRYDPWLAAFALAPQLDTEAFVVGNNSRRKRSPRLNFPMAPKKVDKAKMAAADNRAGMSDPDATLGSVDTDKEAEFATGPMSVLRRAVESETQVLIKLRNSRAVLARIKAFDRHFNMVLQDATELWTEFPKGSKVGTRPVQKDRFISKLFMRGDSVILVLPNPNQ